MTQPDSSYSEGAHDGIAWILWGRRKSTNQSQPLGAYSTREVALEAEDMAGRHPHAWAFEDFWVTPWPLRTTPGLNFRMELVP